MRDIVHVDLRTHYPVEVRLPYSLFPLKMNGDKYLSFSTHSTIASMRPQSKIKPNFIPKWQRPIWVAHISGYMLSLYGWGSSPPLSSLVLRVFYPYKTNCRVIWEQIHNPDRKVMVPSMVPSLSLVRACDWCA